MTSEQIATILSQRFTYRGLTSAAADALLKEYGENIRPVARRLSGVRRFFRIIGQPMMLLLLCAAGVYFAIGSKLETVILLISIIPIIAIEFFQETKTDQAITVLDTLLVDRCQVYRDGKLKEIPSAKLVPGDLVYLTAGDKVPADGIVLRSPGFTVDESVLTGESSPVVKNAANDTANGEHALFQGTLLTQGEGVAVVTATGGQTSYGKLGNLLERIETQRTPLQQRIQHLVKRLALLALFVSLTVGGALMFRQGVVAGALGAITVAMALIPEEFPVVFSVFLIMGVWRMTKHKALVREIAMVETLGSATVICTDKTGTLTEGALTLQKVYYEGKITALTGKNSSRFQSLFSVAILALEQNAVDPIEVETQRFAKASGLDVEQFFSSRKLIKDSSFDAASKMVHHIWQESDGARFQYSAGAPESVIAFSVWKDSAEREATLAAYQKLSEDGYRVIAIARTPVDDAKFVFHGAECIGLLAMSDPPRAGVQEALTSCHRAGIQVIMITGDNPITAAAIARRIGWRVSRTPTTGGELDAMTKEQITELLRTQTIFARIRPEQKYLLVEALQERGEVVAMTGDGVNDAPALKKAAIGIAMGKRGTEVARAAAGIVLLDDNFSTIVNAVREGRRIYDNIRRAFVFLFSFHIPIVGLSVIPIVFGEGLYFLPIHIIFLELFGDPAAVLGFERDALRRGAMQEPPRPVNDPLINPRLWWQITAQGGGILLLTLAFYYIVGTNGSAPLGRTMSFTALVVAQLVLVVLTREWDQVKSNQVLLFIIGATLAVLHLILFVPVIRDLFHFVPLTLVQYSATIGASIVAMAGVRLMLPRTLA